MSPATPGDSVDFPRKEELAQLERLRLDGRLQHRLEQVLSFVREQRAEILFRAAGQTDPSSLSRAVRDLIRELRSVHRHSEMGDQMREIHNEIWYCGERGDHNHLRIKVEWAERHGSNWRRWRIMEYLFVAEWGAEDIAKAVLEP